MPAPEITQLLVRARAGEREAVDELMAAVHGELRRLASWRRPGDAAGSLLDTTALVNEAYLKLFGRGAPEIEDRRHFFAVAATAMRHIVVDDARQRRSRKRGGDRQHVELDSQIAGEDERIEEILAVDEALGRLGQVDERLARVVELRFFAGLSTEEVAEAIGRDVRTVHRDWRKARAILYELLGDSPG